ncbi:MAG: hypothetical protein M5R36_00195 [Deltaproteobacteria bacterium]|nr:hypothetical protein [Deltaproteobacteria bacterium]
MTPPEHAGRRVIPEAWRPDAPVFAFHEDTNANATLITPEGDVYSVAEERLTRRRFQGGFPFRSLEWIESASGYRAADAPVLVFGNRTHFLPRLLGRRFPSFEHDYFGWPHKLMLAYHHLCYLSPVFSSAMEGICRLILRTRFSQRIEILRSPPRPRRVRLLYGRRGQCVRGDGG